MLMLLSSLSLQLAMMCTDCNPNLIKILKCKVRASVITARLKENTSFQAESSVKYSSPSISTVRAFSGSCVNKATDYFYEYKLEKVLKTKNLAKEEFIHHKQF